MKISIGDFEVENNRTGQVVLYAKTASPKAPASTVATVVRKELGSFKSFESALYEVANRIEGKASKAEVRKLADQLTAASKELFAAIDKYAAIIQSRPQKQKKL